MRLVHGTLVGGVDVDSETRCAHFATARDVVALKFGCCERYFSCFRCHETVANHEPEPWPRERFDERAVLCGVCGAEMLPEEYLESEHSCSACDAEFNPGCTAHVHLYFEGE